MLAPSPLSSSPSLLQCILLRMPVSLVQPTTLIQFRTWRGTSLLHITAALGSREALEMLLNIGIPVDVCNDNLSTPLVFAVLAKRPGQVEILLRRGALPMLKDVFGRTPFQRTNGKEINRLMLRRPPPGMSAMDSMIPQGTVVNDNNNNNGDIQLEPLSSQETESDPMTMMTSKQQEQQQQQQPFDTNTPTASVPLIQVAQPATGMIEPRGTWASFLESPPVLGIVLSLCMWILILMTAWCGLVDNGDGQFCVENFNEDNSKGYIVMYIFIILYLCEALFSQSSRYLRNIIAADEGFIESLKPYVERPTVTFHIQCFHYETRIHVEKDSKGHTTYRNEQIQVFTHSASQEWRFRRFWDDNDPYPTFDSLARIKFEQKWFLANEATKRDYDRNLASFVLQNDRDIAKIVDTQFHMPLPADHIAVDGHGKPRYMTFIWYFAYTLLGMSVPYRLWMHGLTAKGVIINRKLLSV